MASPIKLRGRIRFVEDVPTKSEKLSVKARLSVRLMDENLNEWVDVPSDTLRATDNGQPFATMLKEHEGEMANVFGFWTINSPVTKNERGYHKAAHRALRVTGLEFDPPKPEADTEQGELDTSTTTEPVKAKK